LWSAGLHFTAIMAMMPYVNTAYRIRKWGRLPFRRGPTLVIANHQHDLETMAIVMWLSFEGPWRNPTFAASGRRMFEPGFMAQRIPWLAPALRRVDATPLFRALGLDPIENELGSRPFASFAAAVRARHGDLSLDDVFEVAALERAGLRGRRISDLLTARHVRSARTYATMRDLRAPYRDEIRAETRALLDEDLARMENQLARGATLFLTPEGRYTRDGRMGTFREAFRRLAPLADVFVAPVSYDPFRGRRLSMLFRVVGPVKRSAAPDALAAARPVTVSQVLAEWLSSGAPRFSFDEAVSAVDRRLRALPQGLFIDPELRGDAQRVVRDALATMTRLGFLRAEAAAYRRGERTVHPQFPDVADMLAFQSRFFAETIEAERRVAEAVSETRRERTP
jgi:1-acyl-sn-glycerol-3-phosphate acyltransferase